MNTELLQNILDGEYKELRRSVLDRLCEPEFERDLEWTRAEHREQVRKWIRIVGEEGWGALGFASNYGGGDDMGAFLAAFETLAYHDLSLTIKHGVQFGLFAGSIHNLGTTDHFEKFLDEAGHARLPGCFAMTETGHGSNVAGLETEARWDSDTEDFIIHTPTRSAWKDYIGNAAEDAQWATVFAQLIVDNTNHGVHAVLVPIRDEHGNTLPGITTEDDGLKIGLNGVDNGRIAFEHIHVPRKNLLNRFGSIDENGNYQSPIENQNRRFFTMLGTLVGGRISIGAAAISAAKSALTIAIRYANRRRQFGPPEEKETLLLDYRAHQRRLLPLLAKTYALHFSVRFLGDQFLHKTDEQGRRQVELLAAAIKPNATWHAMTTIQECREACGGKGYLAENRFGDLKADMDVFTTFEGDNTILYQLVAKERLKGLQRKLGKGGFSAIAQIAKSGLHTWLLRRNFISRNLSNPLNHRESILAALQYREQRSLFDLAKRYRRLRQQGVDSAEVINRLQPDFLSYAQAYADHLCFAQFLNGIEAISDGEIKNALGKLLLLFGIDLLHTQRAWFLEKKYISRRSSQKLEENFNQLCQEVRPLAEPLVDSFGIPNQLLMAPIAEK